MLELLSKNVADLFIDGITELIQNGEITRSYSATDLQMCKDIDLYANLNVREITFTLDFKYRIYPASLKA